MKKLGIAILALGVMATSSAQAVWVKMDIKSTASEMAESAVQSQVKSVTQSFSGNMEKQLQVMGEAGSIMQGGVKDAITPEPKSYTMSVSSLALEGENVKNPLIGQGVIEQTSVQPTTYAKMMAQTTEEREMRDARQKQIKTELALQAAAKSSLDKAAVDEIQQQKTSAVQAINQARTEREATQIYAHETIATVTTLSNAADVAAANLALVSARTLEETSIHPQARVGDDVSSAASSGGL